MNFRILTGKSAAIIGGSKLLQYNLAGWIKEEGGEAFLFDYKNYDIGKIIQKAPHVIIIDIMEDVRLTVQFINEFEQFSLRYSDLFNVRLPVLFLMGKEIEFEKQQLSAFGAHDYLHKPINKGKMLTCLTGILSENFSAKAENNLKIDKNIIAIADSDEKFVSFCAAGCPLKGFEIQFFKDLKSVKSNLKIDQCRCLIIDLYLQGGQGSGLIDYIREISPKTIVMATIPVIDSKLISDAYAAGIKIHIVKPIPLPAFIRAVKSTLATEGQCSLEELTLILQ